MLCRARGCPKAGQRQSRPGRTSRALRRCLFGHGAAATTPRMASTWPVCSTPMVCTNALWSLALLSLALSGHRNSSSQLPACVANAKARLALRWDIAHFLPSPAPGYTIVSDGADADVWVLNSCTVKNPSETSLQNEIARYVSPVSSQSGRRSYPKAACARECPDAS